MSAAIAMDAMREEGGRGEGFVGGGISFRDRAGRGGVVRKCGKKGKKKETSRGEEVMPHLSAAMRGYATAGLMARRPPRCWMRAAHRTAPPWCGPPMPTFLPHPPTHTHTRWDAGGFLLSAVRRGMLVDGTATRRREREREREEGMQPPSSPSVRRRRAAACTLPTLRARASERTV